MLGAAIKSVSLAYLLGLVTLSLAALYWWAAGRFVAPRHRAGVSFWMVLGVSLLTLGSAAYILWGVVSFRILMVTHYFHALMRGGWAAAIVTGSSVILLLSLSLAYLSWLRSRVPHAGEKIGEAAGLPLRASDAVDTACLVGVVHPEIWVNPDYWSSLDEAGRAAATEHELVHLGRRDNLRKLAGQFIAALYYAVPWLRSWPARFEYYTELAVDDACQRKLGRANYLALVGGAADFVLRRSSGAVASNLSATEMLGRLRTLEAGTNNAGAGMFAAIGALGTVLSMMPVAAVLLHPTSRCLLACYLGY